MGMPFVTKRLGATCAESHASGKLPASETKPAPPAIILRWPATGLRSAPPERVRGITSINETAIHLRVRIAHRPAR